MRWGWVLALVWAGSAAAEGVTRTEEVVCPIGGEVIEVVREVDCPRTGITMSLMPVNTCSDVTLLPICPATGLPLFRDFSAEEVSALQKIVTEEGYLALRDGNDWLRADYVAGRLGTGPDDELQALLMAFGDDPSLFRRDEALTERLLAAIDRMVAERGPDAAPWGNGRIAHIHAVLGETEAARARLAAVPPDADPSGFWGWYAILLTACLADMDRPECRPDAPIEGL